MSSKNPVPATSNPAVPVKPAAPTKPSVSAPDRDPKVISAIYAPSQGANDFFGFCKKVNPVEFEQIVKEGRLIRCGPESIIYLQGEPSDSFYVINDGVVEIVVADEEGAHPIPITYLSKGDIFGETGILTDSPRTASVRVPDSATLLRFDREAFGRLVSTVPAFGHYLAVTLAHRLHKTTRQLHFYSNARELSGSLDFFDLPTIFQTISLSQQHGVMHVFNLTNETLGEFAFSSGSPISGRFMHLYGLQAFYQLFQIVPKANFGFTRTDSPPVVESPLKIHDVNEFIMNAVQMRDEMVELEQKLNLAEDRPIKRVHGHMNWTFEDHKDCAEAVWQILMKEPVPFKDIVPQSSFCRFHTLLALDRLFQTEQVTFAEVTPYGYR